MALPGSGLIRFGRRPAAPAAVPAAEVLASLPVPVLVVDGTHAVVEANAAAESFLNLSRQAMLGRGIDDVLGIHADFRAMAAVPADAPYSVYDVEVVSPGGRRVRADVLLAPVVEQPGWRALTIHSRAAAGVATRLGERHGNRAATGAAALLAHEIKNPLSGISGAAQLLEGSCDAGSAELTRLIRGEVDRIARLIDRMEEFTDTRPLALEPLNIHSILGHVRRVADQGFARGRTVREVYDPSLPPVLGHRDSLVQVLINLLKNAAEATEAGGGGITLTTAYRHGVTVAIGSDRRRALPIEVCVVDEGGGAPADLVPHLFDPFVTTKPTGRGLGLALVDKLVSDGGGLVEYAREGSPPRTVFRLLLPRAEQPR
jgi:two-component system, NtrC family, nitrogen regulation sensor histidine kinase GlnL